MLHLGIVLIFVGLTGAAFNRETKAEIRIGDRLHVGAYTLNVRRIDTGENDNLLWQSALIDISDQGSALGSMTPRREVYKASRQSVGRVDIRHGFNEDLYVNFAGLNADDMPVVEAYLFPLVNWIWIGAIVLLLGTCVTLIPPLPDRAASPA